MTCPTLPASATQLVMQQKTGEYPRRDSNLNLRFRPRRFATCNWLSTRQTLGDCSETSPHLSIMCMRKLLLCPFSPPSQHPNDKQDTCNNIHFFVDKDAAAATVGGENSIYLHNLAGQMYISDRFLRLSCTLQKTEDRKANCTQ